MKTCAVGLLLVFISVGCVNVYWYPLYGDVSSTQGVRVRTERIDDAEVPVYEVDRRGMRDYPVSGDKTRLKIQSPWLRAALLPANLIANMVSNGVVGLVRPFSRGCFVSLPEDFLSGLFYFGPVDAWHGYPFWQPTNLDPDSVDWGSSL